MFKIFRNNYSGLDVHRTWIMPTSALPIPTAVQR